MSKRAEAWLALAAVCLMVLILIYAGRALAHDHNRPELADWYKSLHNGNGYPCCDGSDFDTGSAKRLDDVDWDVKDGHYRVRLDGRWIDVPDSAVVQGPNRAGPAMVWPFSIDGSVVGVRCFMPGSGA